MKLSEAIRLGAMLRPQAFGNLFVSGGSCALGAAYEACGIPALETESLNEVLGPLAAEWNRTSTRGCPACNCRPLGVSGSLCATVAHLNDTHRWTREQIADWVATVEPAETTDVDVSTSDVRGTTVAG